MPEEQNTVLLVCDYQKGILPLWANDPSWKAAVLSNLDSMLNRVRSSEPYKAGQLLIGFVGVAYNAGYPEISSTSLAACQFFKESKLLRFGTDDTTFTPPPAFPTGKTKAKEFVIYKTRASAFHGTNLDSILRANNVRRIVICGLSTSGVTLSTVRQAADLDYELVVLEDCCGDLSKITHDALIQHVFPSQAKVANWEGWVDENW